MDAYGAQAQAHWEGQRSPRAGRHAASVPAPGARVLGSSPISQTLRPALDHTLADCHVKSLTRGLPMLGPPSAVPFYQQAANRSLQGEAKAGSSHVVVAPLWGVGSEILARPPQAEPPAPRS